MLEANDIDQVPAEAFAALSIRRLLLWNNGVEGISDAAFHGLGDHLTELHIREPRLETLPSRVLEQLNSLSNLVIEYTPLKELPMLSNCRSLSSLHIDASYLSSLNSRALHHLPLLKTVQITNSLLEQLGEGSLSHLERLEAVNFTGNRLRTFQREWMLDLPRLKVIDLGGNLLSHADPVIQSLRPFHALQAIHLDDNLLGDLNALFVFPSLISLSAARNRIADVHQLSLEHLPVFRQLDLSSNRIRALPATLFDRVATLQDLNMAGNHIGDGVQIRRILAQLPRLRSLNLDNCRIDSIHQDTLGVSIIKLFSNNR